MHCVQLVIRVASSGDTHRETLFCALCAHVKLFTLPSLELAYVSVLKYRYNC